MRTKRSSLLAVLLIFAACTSLKAPAEKNYLALNPTDTEESSMIQKIVKPDDEWKRVLTPGQ